MRRVDAGVADRRAVRVERATVLNGPVSDEQTLAQRCAETMWANDRASQALGMRLVSVGPGRATLTMTVTDAMINGHDICHGGYVVMLADSAFAFACNTYNQVTVAQGFDVTFLDRGPARRPARGAGGRAVPARPQRHLRRHGAARRRRPAVVAEFRGRSRTIAGTIVAS